MFCIHYADLDHQGYIEPSSFLSSDSIRGGSGYKPYGNDSGSDLDLSGDARKESMTA